MRLPAALRASTTSMNPRMLERLATGDDQVLEPGAGYFGQHRVQRHFTATSRPRVLRVTPGGSERGTSDHPQATRAPILPVTTSTTCTESHRQELWIEGRSS